MTDTLQPAIECEKPKPMTLPEVVEAFLQLALKHPEKEPRTQREGRDNSFLILGFNRAQETLRTLLEHHGSDDATTALANVRAEGQQQPISGPGGMKMWVAA